jgi:hypothetical protein
MAALKANGEWLQAKVAINAIVAMEDDTRLKGILLLGARSGWHNVRRDRFVVPRLKP